MAGAIKGVSEAYNPFSLPEVDVDDISWKLVGRLWYYSLDVLQVRKITNSKQGYKGSSLNPILIYPHSKHPVLDVNCEDVLSMGIITAQPPQLALPSTEKTTLRTYKIIYGTRFRPLTVLQIFVFS